MITSTKPSPTKKQLRRQARRLARKTERVHQVKHTDLPKNMKEVKTRLMHLPALSLKVYNAISDGLYAEAGFTDVILEDIVKRSELTTEQVKGCLTRLFDEGLIWSWNPSNGQLKGMNPDDDFYGTHAHREGWK